MLKIDNISKAFIIDGAYKKQALSNVSLELNKGDFITVIGGNGAGKSTLLNLIAGVYKPDTGNIELEGNDITNKAEYQRAKYIGRVFQDPLMGTSSQMTILENLAIAKRKGKNFSLKPIFLKKEQNLYLEQLKHLGLGLENNLSAKVKSLSGGQRQALTLLMATINQPSILLLDEHTAALDPKTAIKVLELTDKIVKENNLTTIMITHNMRDAIKYGNRLIMMNEGEIIVDVKDENKAKLTVEDLLTLFSKSSNSSIDSDRMLLI